MSDETKNLPIVVVPDAGCVIDSKRFECGEKIGEESPGGQLVACVDGVTRGNLVAQLRRGVARVVAEDAPAEDPPAEAGSAEEGAKPQAAGGAAKKKSTRKK
jgi:hypothetical protein